MLPRVPFELPAITGAVLTLQTLPDVSDRELSEESHL